MLLTATLCLLALGAVMVFSASSTTKVLSDGGLSDSAFYLKRTLMFGLLGLLVMHLVARFDLAAIRRLTGPFLVLSFFLLLVVLVAGTSVNGSSRWIGSGFLQIQPSEIAKVALVLYAADLLARKPKRVKSIEGLMPFLLVVGAASLLIVAEPDLGTALVVAFAAGATLVAAGARMTRPGEDRDGAGRPGAAADRDRALPDGPPHRLPQPRRRRLRRRLPGRAGEDRARLRRNLRRRHRQRRAEGLLPARGPHRHDLGGDRRGARPGRDRRRRRPLRAVRVRRPADRQKSQGQLRQAPRRRA